MDEKDRQNKLLSGKKIATYYVVELRAKVKILIHKTYGDAGFYSALVDEPNKLDDLTDGMTRDLNRYHKDLCFEEVEEAFALGVRKTYGPYMGISIVAMNDWLNNYRVSNARQEALKRVPKKVVQAYVLPTISEEQAQKIEEGTPAAILKEYDGGKGVINNWGNGSYDIMVKKGLIPADHYQRYLHNARQMRFVEIQDERKICRDITRMRELNIEFENLKDTSVETSFIKRIACTYSLVEWAQLNIKPTAAWQKLH